MPSGAASGSRLKVPCATTMGTHTTRIAARRRGSTSARQVLAKTAGALIIVEGTAWRSVVAGPERPPEENAFDEPPERQAHGDQGPRDEEEEGVHVPVGRPGQAREGEQEVDARGVDGEA